MSYKPFEGKTRTNILVLRTKQQQLVVVDLSLSIPMTEKTIIGGLSESQNSEVICTTINVKKKVVVRVDILWIFTQLLYV